MSLLLQQHPKYTASRLAILVTQKSVVMKRINPATIGFNGQQTPFFRLGWIKIRQKKASIRGKDAGYIASATGEQPTTQVTVNTKHTVSNKKPESNY
ncbi:hypothetical protein J7438_06095 [Thalassotalea sp. G20_0]|uniref:hypothetical protein n=1 Tax=Thalassotalea sp. G20_0 TaxID=2821093 RepID=UPI001ADC06EA|nr:hypothetical protein [Thalassotalea sp. G20_0]MBO9493654.1 hypothetical protein [Thalassotalea sp. G20_0]